MPNNIGFLRKTNKYTQFVTNTHSYLFRCCFLLKKTPGSRTAKGLAQGFLSWYWRHPITLHSLVVRSTDVGPKIFQTNYRYVIFCLKFMGSSGMCLEGLRRSLGTIFVKMLNFVGWSKKCLGRSRRVLGVPQTLSKNMLVFMKMSLLLHNCFNCILNCLLNCLLDCLLYCLLPSCPYWLRVAFRES